MTAAQTRGALVDLAALALAPGAGHDERHDVTLDPFVMGGQEYVVAPAQLRLGVGRSSGGFNLRIRADLVLQGACWRCLEPARLDVSLDVREYSGDDATDPDLACEYVDGEVLDLGAWARDAMAEAGPPAILCRDGCAGLCAVCGANLNQGPCRCAQGEPRPFDSRWAGLEDVARRLADEG